MKNVTFKFYSVLKNEDAMPFIGDDLLVAADGLGGAGSAVHAIDRAKHPDMRSEIFSGAFGDLPQISSGLLRYFEELIEPMADEKDDTSALWASRIAIARCVYALTEGGFKGAALDDKKVRADLAEFIAKGLHGAVEKFGLENGKYDDQLLLPTTLAFIRFTEGENSVIAEAVWAGDSRLYALTPSGLKLLSVDDEDDSGAITNLFYADNPKVRLNYIHHEIGKPCILMAVSDGIFDPFVPHEHLGVEHTLLSAISQSGTAEELADNLRGFFDGVHGDDATMAFVSFGFDGIADIKKTLEQRTERILSIRQKQAEMHSALEVMDLSEEEAAHYVEARTADRFDYIIPMLLDAAERGVDDIAVTAEIRGAAESMRSDGKTDAEKSRRERRDRAWAELDRYVLSHPERVTAEILVPALPKSKRQKTAYLKFKETADKLAAARSGRSGTERAAEGPTTQRQKLHERIQAKISECRERFDALWDEEDPKEAKKRIKELEISMVWCRIDNALKFGTGIGDIGRLPSSDRKLAYAVRDYNAKYRASNSERRDAENIGRDYERQWKELSGSLKRDKRLAAALLRDDAIRRFGLNGSDDAVASTQGKKNRNDFLRELKERKTEIVSEIVRALAVGCDRTSVIDGQYNATKLGLFRTYYRLRADPDNGAREFERELLALESEYTGLVDRAES